MERVNEERCHWCLQYSGATKPLKEIRKGKNRVGGSWKCGAGGTRWKKFGGSSKGREDNPCFDIGGKKRDSI